MSTEVQTQRTLEERIQDKIKADLGSLMTDAELTAIVKRGIQKTLFERRTVLTKNNWGSEDRKEISPLINELLEPLIKEEMRRHVEQWVADNRDLVKETVLKSFSQAPADIITAALLETFRSAMQVSREKVEDAIVKLAERVDRINQ